MYNMNVNDVIYSLRNASCICLDVDSTVCTDEGIDVLAEAAGCGQAVMDWLVEFTCGNAITQDFHNLTKMSTFSCLKKRVTKKYENICLVLYCVHSISTSKMCSRFFITKFLLTNI